LIRAIIAAESNFDPLAVSHRGARGLMQLMPDTAKSLGVTDIFDPGQNIDAGVRYLRLLLDRYAGDVRLALAAYNAGILRVRQYGGVPPYRATRLYIKKVLQYQNEFNSGMLPEDVRLPTI
jgi:soluble lytic murein transglycosylase-like protein